MGIRVRKSLPGASVVGHMKISWWQWWPFFRWRVVGAVDAADEVPRRLPRNGAALVGSEQFPKWVAFDCPCRTGHRIMLNLDSQRKPTWRLGPAPTNKLSIAPSVDYVTEQRRCHYFIRDGKVKWTKDSRH